MFEFLVALLIFSIGMTGLFYAQWAGKRLGYEATQRSMASALARDLLERVSNNPSQLEHYLSTTLGDPESIAPAPLVHCDQQICSPEQVSNFDIWQWEQHLIGAAETQELTPAGGLVEPRACVYNNGRLVSVEIFWWGAPVARLPVVSACSENYGDLYDAADAEAGSAGHRRQIAMHTIVRAG